MGSKVGFEGFRSESSVVRRTSRELHQSLTLAHISEEEREEEHEEEREEERGDALRSREDMADKAMGTRDTQCASNPTAPPSLPSRPPSPSPRLLCSLV